MRYILQRLLHFAVVFIVVTFVVLVATRIGSESALEEVTPATASDVRREQIAEQYPYLDDPLPVQWVGWVGDLVTGDWGQQFDRNVSISSLLQTRLPATAFIGLWAIFIGLVIAVPVGVISAYRRDRAFDRVATLSSFGIVSMPPVVIAVALLFLVVTRTDLFSTVAGATYVAPWDNPWEHFKTFFIPALALGASMGAVWSRLLRADMIYTLQSDFVMLAKAKGLSPSRVLWVHALRASVLSLITGVALQMSALVAGTVIVEEFFGPRGVGNLLIVGIQSNQVMVIQAVAVLFVIIVVVVNLFVDFLYAVVDPRIRAARALA